MTTETETAVGEEISPATTPAKQYKGIAILGSHPQTKKLAPFDDDWLIYACSPDNSPFGYSEHKSTLPRVDVWFELHRPIADVTRPYRYLRWLEDMDCPIIMRDKDAMPAFPTSVPYPDKELKERFGPFAFSSSVAYMIAKAIADCEEMGIEHIGLWGIMQQSKIEYIKHATGTQQLLWEAHKADITIALPEEAKHLFDPPEEDW